MSGIWNELEGFGVIMAIMGAVASLVLLCVHLPPILAAVSLTWIATFWGVFIFMLANHQNKLHGGKSE